MAFFLKIITQSDIEKILRETIENKHLHQQLLDAQKWGKFPSTCAHDPEFKTYLFRIPLFIRNESGDRHYCFHHNNISYAVTLIGPFSWEAEIIDRNERPIIPDDETIATLHSAFQVHKEFIRIEGNQLIAVGDEVAPEFKAKG